MTFHIAVYALFALSIVVWGLFEFGLLARDLLRGMGGTAKDGRTRLIFIVGTIAAVLVAIALAPLATPGSPLRLPGDPWIAAAGLPVVWAGLVIRFWAVRELGHAFRTTVEVHDGQDVVDTGPYRLVRHPSYTGLLLIAAGFGLGGGNWPGLALCVVLPALATLRRIRVEENEMIEVLGEPYRDYVTRTKRLFPGVW